MALAGCARVDATPAYLERLEAITQRLTDESLAALPPGTTPTHDGVSGVVDARRRALSSLEALAPPVEFAPEHHVLLTVMADLVDAASAFLDETAPLADDEFFDVLSSSTHIDVLAARVADACDAMRGRARTLGHAVALEC